MRKSLALLAVLLSLTGCAALQKQQTPVFVPPASCLEQAHELPEPVPDLIGYIEEIVRLYGDSAVLREQCRAALLERANLGAH